MRRVRRSSGCGGHGWEWGLVFEEDDAADGEWVVDADERTVTTPDLSDGYSRLRFGSTHEADGWMPVPLGRWTAVAREVVSADHAGGGTVGVRLGYFEEFP